MPRKSRFICALCVWESHSAHKTAHTSTSDSIFNSINRTPAMGMVHIPFMNWFIRVCVIYFAISGSHCRIWVYVSIRTLCDCLPKFASRNFVFALQVGNGVGQECVECRSLTCHVCGALVPSHDSNKASNSTWKVFFKFNFAAFLLNCFLSHYFSFILLQNTEWMCKMCMKRTNVQPVPWQPPGQRSQQPGMNTKHQVNGTFFFFLSNQLYSLGGFLRWEF